MTTQATTTQAATTQATAPAAAAGLDWIEDIKVVLFDLDGTLHEDPRAGDLYTAALDEALPATGGVDLRAEVDAVVSGHHPAVRPGHFVQPGAGVVVTAPEWVAQTATDWQGRPVGIPAEFAGAIRHDGRLRYLGDRWQIIGALAARRGAGESDTRVAFTRAREFVNDPSTELRRFDCVDGLLARLAAGRHLLLATNTPQELGLPLVARLDLSPPFAMVRYDARKPAGCAELIDESRRRWGVAHHEVLVVGDNLWNDLLPPAQLGCRTVHIDPLATDPTGRWSSARYPDLAVFAEALERRC